MPRVVIVMRAFTHSFGLKAGTPSLIASTPVSAVAPEAKARRSRKIPSVWLTRLGSMTGTVCGTWCVMIWKPATRIIRNIDAMNR